MGLFYKFAAVALFMCAWISWSGAAEIASQDISREQIKGLDMQVQEQKRNVLEISAKLMQAEEKINSPAEAQVLIFLAIEQEEGFRLELVKIKIDGKEAANHIYTLNELEALRRGGVQRIYAANIRGGEHSLEMAYIGKSTDNKEIQQGADFKFTKDAGAKFIEITLAGPDSGIHGIIFRD